MFIFAHVVSLAARAWSAKAANDTSRKQINNILEKKLFYYHCYHYKINVSFSAPEITTTDGKCCINITNISFLLNCYYRYLILHVFLLFLAPEMSTTDGKYHINKFKTFKIENYKSEVNVELTIGSRYFWY